MPQPWKCPRPGWMGLGETWHVLLLPGLAATFVRKSYDVRRVDITPLEQRKVTFDTHALVQDLEAHGFGKEQAQTIVSALITLSNVSLDTVYKDMVTQAQNVFILMKRITETQVLLVF
uniref:Coiled-coil domain-containing protein 90B, mitochondrial n=1 Tax=Malurus cyaneus samueli TaxID=2593467 RepID=A0A8C5TNY9_9PASS